MVIICVDMANGIGYFILVETQPNILNKTKKYFSVGRNTLEAAALPGETCLQAQGICECSGQDIPEPQEEGVGNTCYCSSLEKYLQGMAQPKAETGPWGSFHFVTNLGSTVLLQIRELHSWFRKFLNPYFFCYGDRSHKITLA